MVKYVKGDLLDALGTTCDYICHQVNCQGYMGAGIAGQIRAKWPEVYAEYETHCSINYRRGYAPENMLGDLDVVCVSTMSHVINMYSQCDCGYSKKRYTSYDAFYKALENIRVHVVPGNVIGFPKNIGCGLGGGDWRIISAMIESVLGNDYDVYIYEWEG